MFDTILIIVIILAVVIIIRLLFKKFPHLANVNASNLPEVKAHKKKQLILQNRLQRFSNQGAVKLKNVLEPWQDKLNGFFRERYHSLKNLERDLKKRGQEQLSTIVSHSQVIDEMLTSAKQFINSEEYSKAEDTLLEILTKEEHNIEAYKLLAEIYRLRKEYEQARETLEYLLKLSHDSDPAVYYSLADIAKQRGNLKQAAEDYLKSISLSEDNYLYFLSLAEVYLELDKPEQALTVGQRALILSPNNPKILDFLINLCIIIQDKPLAKQYLSKLREVNPENNKLLDFSEKIDILK